MDKETAVLLTRRVLIEKASHFFVLAQSIQCYGKKEQVPTIRVLKHSYKSFT
jgi:hypothetical protein